ncbi:MAG TPA: PIN domain-containing protein [Bryobacteraceae bacterium]|jgi:predicted nucleic acid-binding protein|nr:PIN domain-containing protein [Bryobacteraceae bacterium]
MSAGDGFFVDSNLLLYYIDPVEPQKRARAADWLEALWMAGAGRLSWQVLHEFYWNSVKKMRLSPARGREIVEDLSHWKPVDTSLGLVQQAWQWMDVAQLSYWDALILAAAERSGARYLLSEDFQGGRDYAGVHVLNPFDHSPSEFAF